jgi:hypothetical protein
MSEENDKYPPVNVLNVIRGFPQPRLPHHITPFRFELRNGERHHVRQIRQVHRERVGKAFHYHYVILTKENRYFHLIFDTGTLVWKLVQEVDEELFFS